MFKNFLKTTLQNLRKNKGYSFLNIFGLSIGIACAGLIFLWVEDELSFDDYFADKEVIYKIKDHQTYEGTTYTFDATPGPLAKGIREEIPGIKKSARSTWQTNNNFSLGDKDIKAGGFYVDSAFLSIFRVRFLSGDPKNAFADLHSVVITKKMAEKFFNDAPAKIIGKTIRLNRKDDYMITGIVEDLPENVSVSYDWLIPFTVYENENDWLQRWGNNGVITYVETDPAANIASINAKLYNYLDSKEKDLNAKFSIYPLTRWHLYDTFDNGKEVPGRIKFVRLFSLIAWIILIIACINFMNLATARSEKRAREVGVRKVLGAARGSLILQFMLEAFAMALLSALFAVVLMAVALPSFNSLVEKQLTLQLLNPVHFGALLLIALICGLVSGSYPAFYLSAFNPVTVLKGLKINAGISSVIIRRVLVVVQFSISLILIISTLLIFQQIRHVKNRDAGYDRDNLIMAGLNEQLKNHFEAIKNDLVGTGVVKNATMSGSPVLRIGSNTGDFAWQGKDPSRQILIGMEWVYPGYVATMGMTVKEGRDFNADVAGEKTNILINERLAELIGKKDNAVGNTIFRSSGETYTIVGVVKDFVYNSVYNSAAPLILFPDTANLNVVTIRLKKEVDMRNALQKVESVMKADNPGFPFEYSFVDQEFAKSFKAEGLIEKLAGVFSVLAILISCLGLFGLAAFTAEKRKKEIGIRKTLGASVRGLAMLLSQEFMKLVAIACLIAFPLAWWIMSNWLSSYAYRIKISWIVFGIAGVLALLIALITVSFQAIKAAVANPVDSLRRE